MLETGKILQGRYRIGEQIGQGGMGSVYIATDERFGSTVAIKETLIADHQYRKAFKREARLLNSLKHTALPKVSDHFIEDDGQYIVMEYITGDDLYEMMEKAGSAYPISDVVVWAKQLLEALEYLHNQQNPIIHRDIKPQNLKLTPHGQVILLDFGLAKGNPTDANHHTAANSIFGYSRNYASLEQIQGTGTDPRSDFYSLAATLYHLATGKPPADALTRVMMVMNEDEDPLQPANLVHDQIDERFAKALEKCMSLNANLRPQSVSEMYETLFGEERQVVVQTTKPLGSGSVGSGLSTQNTKVFPEGDAPASRKQSEIRTEVMPLRGDTGARPATRVTEARTLVRRKGRTQAKGIITQNFSNRRRVFAAAAAGILLLVGTVLSTVYFFNPWEPVPAIDGETINFASNTTEGASNSADGGTNSELADAAAEDLDSDVKSSPAAKEKAEKPVDAPKTVPNAEDGTDPEAATDAVVNAIDMSREEMLVLEKELGKDLKVRDGRVETEKVIIDDSGVTFKDPAKPGRPARRLPITREEYEALTPAQRRKLRNLLELQRRIRRQRKMDPRRRRIPPPSPSPPVNDQQ